MTRTMVLSDCGHASGAPRGVCDQSSRRMRSPISPPPARKSRLGRSAAAATRSFLSCCDMRSLLALRGVRGTRSVNPILLQPCAPPRPGGTGDCARLCVAAFEYVAHLPGAGLVQYLIFDRVAGATRQRSVDEALLTGGGCQQRVRLERQHRIVPAAAGEKPLAAEIVIDAEREQVLALVIAPQRVGAVSKRRIVAVLLRKKASAQDWGESLHRADDLAVGKVPVARPMTAEPLRELCELRGRCVVRPRRQHRQEQQRTHPGRRPFASCVHRYCRRVHAPPRRSRSPGAATCTRRGAKKFHLTPHP